MPSPFQFPPPSRIIAEATNEHSRKELLDLDLTWAPWGWQVNRYVMDGGEYGRPGQRTLVSQTNYLSRDDAEKGYAL